MKNKIFSGGIYRESLRRLKVFTIIFAAIVLLFEIAPPVIEGLSFDPAADSKITACFSEICLTVPFISVVCAFAAVMLTFTPFNKRSYSDFAHSLPYTRTCLFFSKTAAIYTCIIGLMVLAALSGIAAYSAFGKVYALDFSGFGLYFLRYISVSTFIVSCFSIATAITGTVLSNITAALLIMFFPRFVAFLMTEAVTNVLPFMCGDSYLPLLSPRYNTFIGLFSPEVFFSGTENPIQAAAPIIYTLIISAIYTAIALILFKKRKSETAEMPAPGRGVQCAIRTLVALVLSLPATIILAIDTDDMDLAIILYILALIAYFAYELITVKSFKSLARAIPALGIVVLINLLFAGVFFGVKTAAAGFIPTANETDSVCLVDYSGAEIDDDYYSSASKVRIKDLKVKATVTNALRENVDAWKDGTYNKYYSEKYPNYLCFGIRSGVFTRYRLVYLTSEEYQTVIGGISANEEFKKMYMELPAEIPGTLKVNYLYPIPESGEREVLDTLQKEIEAAGFEKWYSICRGNGAVELYDSATRTLDISYSVFGLSGKKLYAPVNSEICPKTFELLMKYSVDERTKTDFDSIIKRINENPVFDGDDFFDITLNVFIDGKVYSYYTKWNDDGTGIVADKDIAQLMDSAAKSGKAPDAERFMDVTISMTTFDFSDGEDYYVSCFLPIPDGFDLNDYPQLEKEEYGVEIEPVEVIDGVINY